MNLKKIGMLFTSKFVGTGHSSCEKRIYRARKTELNVLWHSTGFPSGLSGLSGIFFFVSSVCLLVRVTMVDKNKAVVCCLLATSIIMLSEKKKKKVYLSSLMMKVPDHVYVLG
jgi:hypothetical protein